MLVKLRGVEHEISNLVRQVHKYGIEVSADLIDDKLAAIIRELTILRHSHSVQDNLRRKK